MHTVGHQDSALERGSHTLLQRTYATVAALVRLGFRAAFRDEHVRRRAAIRGTVDCEQGSTEMF